MRNQIVLKGLAACSGPTVAAPKRPVMICEYDLFYKDAHLPETEVLDVILFRDEVRSIV